jgi:hypothetical protein
MLLPSSLLDDTCLSSNDVNPLVDGRGGREAQADPWTVELYVATQEREVAMVWLEKEYCTITGNGSYTNCELKLTNYELRTTNSAF